MNMTPSDSLEPRNPIGSQYPLRPMARTGAFRIHIGRSLRLHPVTATLAALLTLGMGLAFYARHKPTYMAASVLYVSPTVPKTLTADSELERPYDNQIQETIHAINRYDILAEALHHMSPDIVRSFGDTERVQVRYLQQSLDINRVGGSYQVEIAFTGSHPEHLADVVNIITNTYLDKAKSEEFYGRDERLAALKEERTRIQNDINSRLAEQARISRELGVASVDGKDTAVFDDQNSKRREDLIAAHEQRVEAAAQLDALKNADPSASSPALNAAADEAIANDPGLVALKTSLSQKRATLLDELAGMTAANPMRKQSEEQLAQIEKALQDMQADLRKKAAAHLEQKLQTQLNQAAMIESKLNADLQNGSSQAASAAPKFQRAGGLQTEIDRLQARYTAVDERISNFELESSSPGSVHLFSPAMPPLGPEKSKMRILLLGIFPFSLMVGVVAAVVLDLFDPHIYTGADTEAVLGFAPIGMLFDEEKVPQSVFDQCALRLAAGIDHASRQAATRTFVITGVNSGAGTTTVIEHMGSMLAKLGRKTLVIDSSGVAEPVAYVTFGSSLERKPVDLSQQACRRDLPPGSLQSAAPAKFSNQLSPFSSFVFQSFQAISSDYDIVLIDAAPILLSAETEYLARLADVTILLSEAGKTKKSWLTRAARLREKLGVAGAASIVNKVDPNRVEDALKDDLREFELRNERLSTQEWWRPSKKPAKKAPASPYSATGNNPEPEDEIYAHDTRRR